MIGVVSRYHIYIYICVYIYTHRAIFGTVVSMFRTFSYDLLLLASLLLLIATVVSLRTETVGIQSSWLGEIIQV